MLKTVFAILLLALILVGLFFLSSTENKEQAVAEMDLESPQLAHVQESQTVATHWNWQRARAQSEMIQQNNPNFDGLPFTAQSVFDALQTVKLDENGNLILDHDALLSLDEALERIYNKLDADSLRLLQDLIRESLPGNPGEQTAKIVEQYLGYLQAKDEFSRINDELSGERTSESMASIVDDQALYSELQALRELHLGTEATSDLFRVTDANATYMFESMKLGLDTTLNDEQREERHQAIQEQHIAQSVNIRDWPNRYLAFMNEKRAILSSSLDDEEKRRQVLSLLGQHFSHSEIERIRYLELGTI